MRLALVLILSCLIVAPAVASETRGLKVIAKDPATGNQEEVRLYNKSYAVIIGIDQYPSLPPDRQLSYAVRDAQGVEQVLRKHYRFDRIVTLYNQHATKERILKLLTAELPREMGSEDSLFVFWAGHGNQEPSPDGEIGYLLPYDGSTEEIYKNITMTEVRDTISKKIPAKHVFYAMDACYSGLLTTRAVDRKVRRDLSYLKEVTRERVRQILTAGGKGEEVLDGGPKGHSVFTGRLIEVLEQAGDFVTANEIQSILKEKVYNDAKGRGHKQIPSFGALVGNGEYVFVPNLDQKVTDNKVEIARIEEELTRLNAKEAKAKAAADISRQHEVERARKVAEAMLKAEQLKKLELEAERQRQLKAEQERVRFQAVQKQKEDELFAAKFAEEQHLVALKAELERKKKTLQITSGEAATLEAAVAEIQRLNSRIEEINLVFDRESEDSKNRISSRYEAEITKIQHDSKLKIDIEKDEFETEEEYKTRVARRRASFDERIAELRRKKQAELEELDRRVKHEQTAQTAELRSILKQLSEKEYTIGAEAVDLELGQYDAEKQRFPVKLNGKKVLGMPASVNYAMNGTIPLQRDEARKFKQAWQRGLVRPEVVIRAGDGIAVKVAIANDADSYLLTSDHNRQFLTVEQKRRLDKDSIFIDAKTGLVWAKDANILGTPKSWKDAMSWVKQLNYAGYSDWRLPTKEELVTFAEDGGDQPWKYLGGKGFQNVERNGYWSSTSTNSNVSAWYVSMGTGYVNIITGNDLNYVWPVREAR